MNLFKKYGNFNLRIARRGGWAVAMDIQGRLRKIN